MSRISGRSRALSASILLLAATPAFGHGVVGDRFFPATLTTDDPFAADELALPTVTVFNHETDYDVDYSKSIFRGVAISIGGGYVDSHPPGGPKATGWKNISITPAAELYRDPDHEAIVTAGFVWEIGGSGSKSVADRASSYTPEILFGKGFGDLPDSMALLRPLAVTGQLGFQIPGTSANSKAVQWAGAVEYSLLYLENNVRDVGLTPTEARFTLLVEFSLSSPVDRGGGETTGTISPGIAWLGHYSQLTAEAMIPVNAASGRTVGAIFQLHLYIDDIFPQSLGRPLFGDRT